VDSWFWGGRAPDVTDAGVLQGLSTGMTTELHLTAAMSRDQAEPLTLAQKEALQRAVAKVVALGAQVGVSVDQMVQLLQAGLTVGELLEYLAARVGEVA
jgi:hypothetical protein